jgi:hypothetical protein
VLKKKLQQKLVDQRGIKAQSSARPRTKEQLQAGSVDESGPKFQFFQFFFKHARELSKAITLYY